MPLPGLMPAILTGFRSLHAPSASMARIFIAGNIPYISEIAPLLIVIRLEEFDYVGAAVIAAVMLIISFALLFLINLIQTWARRRFGYGS